MGMEYAGVCPGMWVPTPIGPAPRPSRGKSPVNGSCDWYNQGCQPGCSECNPKRGHVAAAFGFGMGAVGPVESAEMFKYWQDIFSFNLIDKVQIPADLTPGDYVLSFRWDCEQTPQIWNNCADVTIAPPAIV